jgi:hypothetical protein
MMTEGWSLDLSGCLRGAASVADGQPPDVQQHISLCQQSLFRDSAALL